jgi:hypothetical protein
MGIMLSNALVFGIILSLVLAVIMGASMVIAPDMWVNDYPPDIKAKYGEMSEKAKRLRPYIAIPFFLALVIIPLLALARLRSLTGEAVGFFPAYITSFTILFVFNLFDLLVADWLLFVTIQPRRIVLSGTEGMAGYRDYRFHFIGFLKGLVFCAVGALVLSGVWLGLQWLFIGGLSTVLGVDVWAYLASRKAPEEVAV